MLFTPPQRCAVARRPETRPGLLLLWLCVCGTAAPGNIQDPPPPTGTAWGTGQSEGGGAAHPRTGGGGAQLSGPSIAGKHRQAGTRPSREDGDTQTPPPPRSGHEWSYMTRPGMDAQGGRSHNPTPPEVLAQARPPAVTPSGA